MSIRTKIILVVLPILLSTVLLVGFSSYFAATSGINNVARAFLGFKSTELQKYADSQWTMVVENKLNGKPEFDEAVRNSIGQFAKGIIGSSTELIVALSLEGALSQSTSPLTLQGDEGLKAIELAKNKPGALVNLQFGGIDRVGQGFLFQPLNWYLFITEQTGSYYSSANQIRTQTIILLSAAVVLATTLLFLFARTLTRPLRTVVDTMKDVISSGDLSKAVQVEYADEIGTLAHTFNIMTGELDKAWKQIKNYAYQAVIAQKNEQRLKNVFQRYVPQEIIDNVVSRPEKALIGEERELAVLFSDIRSFTTISESMTPTDLVTSLNQYFSFMVDTIVSRKGIVDKYIGDAIMAFWGAPVRHEDDAMQAVLSAIEMNQQLKTFNDEQVRKGKPPFKTGIGINFGMVTVGNIGTDKKMDYTVIGDPVNLASRLEGLTKEYHVGVIISEFLQARVPELPHRLLDAVAVKGKTKGVRIFTVEKTVDPTTEKAWGIHNEGMGLYFDQQFGEAANHFNQVLSLLPGDENAQEMRERCEEYRHNPPGPDWDGVKVMTKK